MPRVVVAHRNPAFRKQLADLLMVGGMDVDDTVEDPRDIDGQMRFREVDILVLDTGIFAEGIPDSIGWLKRSHPKMQIVFLGPEPRAYYARHMAEIGADLYLSEEENPREWLRKLRALLSKARLLRTETAELEV